MGNRVPPDQNDAIGRRFSLLKKRTEQQGTARRQREEDALKRAQARSGMQTSGAFIKQGQLAREARERDISEAKEALDVAESGERFQQEQIERQRAFQRGEREASQKFAAEQAGLGREFARSERLGSQQFQSMEAGKQRGFSKNLFDREMKFKNKQFQEGIRQFTESMDFSKMDSNRRFDLDKKVTDFNMDMAEKQFNKRSMTEYLMGGAQGGDLLNRWTGGKWFGEGGPGTVGSGGGALESFSGGFGGGGKKGGGFF